MADLMQGLDGPRTAQQELFYDLEDARAVIGWAVVELTNMASDNKSRDESKALMRICALLEAQKEKIRLHADEVKAGRTVRAERAHK